MPVRTGEFTGHCKCNQLCLGSSSNRRSAHHHIYNRGMMHEILAVGMLACNCSIFGDESNGEAIVVDPGDDAGKIQEILQKHNLTVKRIVLTHAHIDHIGGVAELVSKTGAPVYLNFDDLPILDQLDWQAGWLGVPAPKRFKIDAPLREGDIFRLGVTQFHVLHTPGHTPGSVSLWIPQEKKLISGDTLFRDSMGRTDLPGGDAQKILQSIRQKLLTLPADTIVMPGHGPGTTIGWEKQYNPFFRER